MRQGGPKVATALARAPEIPATFHPTKPIIRIMFGPGIARARAKKPAKSSSVIQRLPMTKSRTSGRTVGKPPKLIDDRNASCAASAMRLEILFIAFSYLQSRRRQRRAASGQGGE